MIAIRRSVQALSLLLLGAQLAQIHASIIDGMVLYYPFNGNAADESGSGNHGIVVGAQLGSDRFGTVGNSYSFSAQGQYVETSASTGFPVGMQDFTVSLWVALNGLINDHQILFANGGVNQFQLDVFPSATSVAPMDFLTGGDYGVPDVHTTDMEWTPEQWYNLQVVRASDTVSIYRDGSLIVQNSVSAGNDAPDGSQNLRFGFGVPPQLHQLYGQLDDIRIYDRALSSDELQSLYRLESSQVVPDRMPTAWMTLPVLLLAAASRRCFSGVSC
jgi:hypothetical protein